MMTGSAELVSDCIKFSSVGTWSLSLEAHHC